VLGWRRGELHSATGRMRLDYLGARAVTVLGEGFALVQYPHRPSQHREIDALKGERKVRGYLLFGHGRQTWRTFIWSGLVDVVEITVCAPSQYLRG